MSATTAALLSQMSADLEPRGLIDVKGKGGRQTERERGREEEEEEMGAVRAMGSHEHPGVAERRELAYWTFMARPLVGRY